MMETPVVVIDCQRAGPSTGVPTKTEQGDLWQMLGAAFGDYPRVLAAPLDIGDCFKIISEIFNIADRFQCPGIVLCDLLLSEGRLSVDPKDLDFAIVIDRGELITKASSGPNGDGAYKRYKITESGVSPRAVPGIPGYTHTAVPAKRLTRQSIPDQTVQPFEPLAHVGDSGGQIDPCGWTQSKHGLHPLQCTHQALERIRIKIRMYLDPAPARQHHGQPTARFVLRRRFLGG